MIQYFRQNIIQALLFLNVILFCNSCFIAPVKKVYGVLAKNCLTADHIEFDSRETGVYVNDFSKRQISVTIDSKLDLSKSYFISEKTKQNLYFFTAEEIGMIADILLITSEEYFDKAKTEKLENSFKNIHVIVAENKESFDRIWLKPNDKKNYHAKMSLREFVCYDIPNEAKFSAVFMPESFLRNEPEWIIHEFLHMVSYQIYGNLDLNHSNKTLWDKPSKKNPSTARSLLTDTANAYKILLD